MLSAAIENASLRSVIDNDIAYNVRTRDFEVASQREIDTTTWAPNGSLRDYIRRTLKRNDGTFITDLDCLAAKGDTCLLIDAKTHVVDGLWEQEHRAIRNVETELRKNLKTWAKRTSEVTAAPCGRNFDLSAWTHLVPVIVTPAPYWTTDAAADVEVLPGLRAVTTLSELIGWLTTH